MSWIPTLLALLALLGVALLARRAYVVWTNHAEARAFGVMATGIGGTALIVAALNETGFLVHSADFGLVLVQGRLGLALAVALLALVTAAVAVVLYLSCPAKLQGRLTGWLIIAAVAVMAMSLAGIVRVDPVDIGAPRRVFAYDLWWPPLVLWTLLGTLTSVVFYLARTLKPPPLPVIWLGGAIVIAAAAVVALVQSPARVPAIELPFREDWSWLVIGVLATAVAIWMGFWLLPELSALSAHAIPAWMKMVSEQISAAWKWAVSPFTRSEADGGGGAERRRARSERAEEKRRSATGSAPTARAYVATLVSVAYAGGVIAGAWWDGKDTLGYAPILAGLLLPVATGTLLVAIWAATDGAAAIRDTTRRERYALLAFGIALATGVDLGWFSGLPAMVDLPLLAGACWLLAAMVETPDRAEPFSPAGMIASAGAQIREATPTGIRAAVKKWVVRTRDVVKQALHVDSAPVMVVKLIIAALVLVMVNEIPDTGKTVFRPFQAHFYDSPGDLGDAVADRVYYSLRRLYDEVAVESMIPETMPRESGIVGSGAVPVGAALDAPLGKDETFEISGIKVPTEIVVRPIQSAMRAVLRTRSITGVVHADSNVMRLAITVERGHTWSDSAVIRTTVAGTPPKGGDTTKETRVNLSAPAVDSMAERIAFDILTDADADLVPGMTHSWTAFQLFRKGLVEWRRFQANRNDAPRVYDQLTAAIDDFRSAIHEDPNFAIAYYRLGVALNAYGEPSRAVEAYRQSLATNVFLPPAANALAFAVANTEAARTSRPMWYQILGGDDQAASPVDQAAAYLGLCQDFSRPHPSIGAAEQRSVALLGYYYCKRAATVFNRLPRRLASHAGARQVESRVAYQLGDVFSRFRPARYVAGPQWSCGSGTDSLPVVHPRYSAAAVGYFREAQRFGNPDAACRIALLDFAHGDATGLMALVTDGSARVRVADGIANEAMSLVDAGQWRRANGKFRRAANEYQRGMHYGQRDFHSLNNYAYMTWRWRHGVPEPDGPTWRELDAAAAAQRALSDFVIDSDNDHGVTARSTRAELLLAMGRPHEALDELRSLMPLLPLHWFSNETRQDYARAAVCAATSDGRSVGGSHYDSLMAEATNILDGLRESRQQLRDRDNNVSDDELTIEQIAARCSRPRPPSRHEFDLRVVGAASTGSPEACRWTGVRTAVANGARSRPRVRVTSGETVITSSADSTIWIAAHAERSHGQISAQLVDSAGETLSDAVAVDTSPDCQRQVTVLSATPVGSQAEVLQTGSPRTKPRQR